MLRFNCLTYYLCASHWLSLQIQSKPFSPQNEDFIDVKLWTWFWKLRLCKLRKHFTVTDSQNIFADDVCILFLILKVTSCHGWRRAVRWPWWIASVFVLKCTIRFFFLLGLLAVSKLAYKYNTATATGVECGTTTKKKVQIEFCLLNLFP